MIPDYNYDWKKELNNYTESKNKHVVIDKPVEVVTHKSIKKLENYFNPITQKYNDKSIQDSLIKQENKYLPDKLAKYYDKSLRYEQTYDIINLKDKLYMFKDHPLYPKPPQEIINKRNINSSKKDYNILSNLNSYQMNDNNNNNNNNNFNVSNKQNNNKSKYIKSNKDYDIISNKYLKDNEIKNKTNDLLFKIEAANNYWKTHNFDCIAGKYYNDEKEKKYQEEFKAKQAVWGKDKVKKLPKKVIEQGLLYNPVNQKVLDKERLDLFEAKEYNKMNRYRKRLDIENYHCLKNAYEADIKNYKDSIKRNAKKNDYIKTKDNIVINNDFYKDKDNKEKTKVNSNVKALNLANNSNLYKLNTVDNTDHWIKVSKNCNSNNAEILNVPIYKDVYDYSDVPKEYKRFKEDRSSKNVAIIYNILLKYI